jgi:hypothetical protein
MRNPRPNKCFRLFHKPKGRRLGEGMEEVEKAEGWMSPDKETDHEYYA